MLLVLAFGLATQAIAADPAPDPGEPGAEVAASGRAFARSMIDRDFDAAARLIAADAVFIEDPESLRGREQILEGWRVLYAQTQAPLSWEPGQIEVLPSGRLALATSPVHDRDGQLIGTFTAIWRKEEDGAWRIVFLRGEAVCRCTPDAP